MKELITVSSRIIQQEPVNIHLEQFSIEGKLNSMHFRKGWNRRFRVIGDDDILFVHLRNNKSSFTLAVYLEDKRKLIGVAGLFSLHWKMIQRVFKEEYGNDIEIIGDVL